MKVICTIAMALLIIGSATYGTASEGSFHHIGEIQTDFSPHHLHPYEMPLSPSGEFILLIGDDIQQIWRVADQTLVYEQHGYTDQPGVFAWSPDGQYLAIGTAEDGLSTSSEIIIWDTRQEEAMLLATMSFVYDLGWHPHQPWLVGAIGTQDGVERMVVWDIERGTELLIASDKFTGNISDTHVDFSPDGTFLVSVDYEQLYFWDVPSYEPLPWFDDVSICGECVTGWEWSSDQRYLLLSTEAVLDLKQHQFIDLNQVDFEDYMFPYSLVWSPTENILFSANGLRYDPATQTIEAVFPAGDYNLPFGITPDGRYVLFVNVEQQQINIWDMQTAEYAGAIQLPDLEPRAIAINASNIMAIADVNGTVYLFEYMPDR